MEDDYINVFTDGSCINNGKKSAKAGFAVLFPESPEHNYASKLQSPCTNNRAEFSACIKAIEICNIIDDQKPIKIYTDSELLIKTMTKYIKAWKKNQWRKADNKPICNLDLVLELDALTENKQIIWNHVIAHTGKQDWISQMNDRVDKMAKQITFSP
jgi:ribonuclease HI